MKDESGKRRSASVFCLHPSSFFPAAPTASRAVARKRSSAGEALSLRHATQSWYSGVDLSSGTNRTNGIASRPICAGKSATPNPAAT